MRLQEKDQIEKNFHRVEDLRSRIKIVALRNRRGAYLEELDHIRDVDIVLMNTKPKI